MDNEYDPNYTLLPYEAPWCNDTMHAPPGQEGEVGDLPVCITDDGHGHTITASGWHLTDEQRAMIAAGAEIRLTVWQHPIPPLAVGIEAPWCTDCRDRKWFHYERTRFECHCASVRNERLIGAQGAEDDQDAARRAAPADIAADFTPAPVDDGADRLDIYDPEARQHPWERHGDYDG